MDKWVDEFGSFNIYFHYDYILCNKKFLFELTIYILIIKIKVFIY